MSAAASEVTIDPARVRIPTGDAHIVRFVADLSDVELDREELADVQQIRMLADEYGFVVGDDGVPAAELAGFDGRSETVRIAARSINAARRRVLACRAERDRRTARTEGRASNAAAEARALLEDLVGHGPAKAAKLAELGAESQAAFERVRGLVRDLELLGATPTLERSHRELCAAIDTAAAALKRPTPALSTLPTLPDRAEVTYLLRAIVDVEILRDRGLLPDLGGMSKASDAAELLSSASTDW